MGKRTYGISYGDQERIEDTLQIHLELDLAPVLGSCPRNRSVVERRLNLYPDPYMGQKVTQ